MSRAVLNPSDAGPAASSRLTRRAVRGDRDAFEEVFRLYHQELYRYCLAIVHDREDAEDALQATMAAALRSLPGEKRDLALRPWLYRVAHNESISLIRARRDHVSDDALVDSAELAASAAGGMDSATELEGRERLRQLVTDLQSLPERQRSAIVMRELNDLSYEEIGKALDSSEAAARQTVYEARTALFAHQEGREMECDRVREAISARDGRRLRGRKVRAHLRVCEGCQDFQAVIGQRRDDLQALFPPLPALAASGLLAGLIGGTGGGSTVGGVGAVAGGGGAGIVGGGLAGSAAIKGASVLAAAVVAVGAADVSGVLDLPNPVGGSDSGREDGAPAAPEAGSNGTAGGASVTGGGQTTTGSGSAQGGNDGSAGGAQGGNAGGSSPGDASHGNGNSSAAAGHTESSGGHGNSDAAPGHTGVHGNSASAPGHTGEHGNSTSTPGHTGTQGNSASAPGHTGESAGKSETAPGQTKATGGNAGGGSVKAEPPPKPATPPKAPPANAGGNSGGSAGPRPPKAVKPPKPAPAEPPAQPNGGGKN